MDFLERKIIEIIQTNNDINKEDIPKSDQNNSYSINKGYFILEKVSGKIFCYYFVFDFEYEKYI